MIEFALANPLWDHKQNWHHRIDAMVYELLGFNRNWNVWITTDGVASQIEAMSDLYGNAAAKWFSLPKVLSGFVHFAQLPVASGLAIESIPWIVNAVREYDDYNWRHGTDDNLIEFLGTCWQRDAKRITEDPALRSAFFEIVRILVARGSHAALALQDRVSNQTPV
ncbi:MAG TPA: hypothetical protein VGP68_02495 [Gemmataceae bacterium]|jgi:hypothetical protein|nr:hypothetical protein [Gemmataceae bacterium]